MQVFHSNHRLVLTALLGLAMCGPAMAQEVPVGCSFAGAGAAITRFPSSLVNHNDRICYTVQFNNGAAGVNCELRNFDGDLHLPDGTSIPILRNATIASGTSVVCPGADPRCQTPSNCTIPGRTGYEYIVEHEEEVASFSSCPPSFTAGIGRAVAYAYGDGNSLTSPPDFANACATANNFVNHGSCCEPCSGACTPDVSCNECPADRVYTKGGSCSAACQLVCGDEDACTTDGQCVPGSGRDNCSTTPGGTPATCEPNVSFCDDAPPDFSCDDGLNCTIDNCDDENPPSCCVHEPLCPQGQCCADGDLCDDGNSCTVGTCVGGCCVQTPLCITSAGCAAGDADACPDLCADGCCVRVDCRCGDGVLTPPEICDDGNNVAGDGCSPTCNREQCGNNFLDPGEVCDGDSDAACQPNGRCADDCTCQIPDDEIPTVSQWGMVILTLLLLTAAKLRFAHRRAA